MLRRSQAAATPAGAPRAGGAFPLTLLLILGAGLTGLRAPAGAEMYRWVDETGTTVYSQLPPPKGAAVTLKPDPGPSAEEVERASANTRRLIEQDFDKREDQARAAKEAEDAANKTAAQATLQKNCEAARKNLETLQNHGRGRLRTPDGKSQYYTDDELARFMDEARGQIKANCK